MDFADFIRESVILVPIILLALTFHELSHGLMAERFGDNTARVAGRITLNPFAHLDPVGTLMMFLVHFGWAKPVPVDPRRMRNPRKDMIWVSFGGPASNILLALVFGIAIRYYLPSLKMSILEFHLATYQKALIALLILGLEINLALAFFNLIPIHPLDGSKILSGILPLNQAYSYSRLEPYGMMILLGLIFIDNFARIPIFSIIIWLPVKVFSTIFSGVSFLNLQAILTIVMKF